MSFEEHTCKLIKIICTHFYTKHAGGTFHFKNATDLLLEICVHIIIKIISKARRAQYHIVLRQKYSALVSCSDWLLRIHYEEK